MSTKPHPTINAAEDLPPLPRHAVARWALMFLHAIFMLLILYWWIGTGFTLQLESTLLKWQSRIKTATGFTGARRPHFAIDDFIWVDISANRIPVTDPATGRNTHVVDRAILAEAFRALQSNPIYWRVLCDVAFDVPAPGDDSLLTAIHELPRASFPRPSQEGRSAYWYDSLPGGTVQYSLTNNWWQLSDALTRFRLAGPGGEKSLPLVMVEEMRNTKLKRSGRILELDNDPRCYLNHLAVDPVIKTGDFMREDSVLRRFDLGDISLRIMTNTEEENKSLLENKIIVIGDFSGADNHQTAFGEMPGALILANLVISFYNAENSITWQWVVFMFAVFTAISWLVFYGPPKPVKKRLQKVNRYLASTIFSGMLGKGLRISAGLFLVSLISYFIFHKNIEIIGLLVYLSAITFVMKKVREWRRATTKPVGWKGWLRFIFL